MTTRIPQRTGHDCGACSLAMLLSIPYDDAIATIKAHQPTANIDQGCYYPDLINAAKDLGVELGVWHRGDHLGRNEVDDMPVAASILDTAVAPVSLRTHFVYMDPTGIVYDPHPPREGPQRPDQYLVRRSLYVKHG